MSLLDVELEEASFTVPLLLWLLLWLVEDILDTGLSELVDDLDPDRLELLDTLIEEDFELADDLDAGKIELVDDLDAARLELLDNLDEGDFELLDDLDTGRLELVDGFNVDDVFLMDEVALIDEVLREDVLLRVELGLGFVEDNDFEDDVALLIAHLQMSRSRVAEYFWNGEVVLGLVNGQLYLVLVPADMVAY